MIATVFAFSTIANAGQLVILSSTESKTDEVIQKLEPNAEFITWSDLRGFPLAFSGIAEHKSCFGNTSTLEELQKSLESAESAVAYLETQNALGHVRQIENKLPCLKEPISKGLLVRSNYIAGVAYNYDSKTDQAKAAWRKALMYDPSLKWDENIEPSGKGAFYDVKNNVQSQATTSLVLVPSTAKITVDGTQVANGDTVIAGEHFVQHDTLGYQSHSITTEMGTDSFIISFADFPEQLSTVMEEQSSRQAMLKGVLLFQDKTDVRVVTDTDYWYLQLGTTKWKSQSLGQGTVTPTVATNVTPTKPTPVPNGNDGNPGIFNIDKPWFFSGVGLLAVGGGSFFVAKSQADLFDGYDETADRASVENAYGLNRTMWWTGTVLSTVGGGLMVKGSISF